MGGCASKPKELDVHRDSVPSEAPASPKKAEAQESVAQESKNEAPLVDVSEPKEEGENTTETKAADVEVVSAEAAEDVTAKPEEEEKPEASPETTEEDKVKVEAVDETQETPKEGQVEANKTEDSDAAPA
ncbi:hypothetical protein L484_001581 [Morus notabilis]|uniref:Uncharacterized protein n=1 Tax=Morus notabilis TaxID=981085 RepID=W9QJ17_9ROSA|nr:nucleosome assembly protein 1-like 3 isoform X1 [Morus notabilis]EXB24918.1 hypothetical protein L484_001581 [Morus notabilis]